MSDSPTVVADYDCQVGENPLWHPDEQQVYWTDQFTGRLFRYDPGGDSHEQFYDGDDVTGFTLQSDGSLLVFMDGGAVKRLDDGELTTVVEEVPEIRESRRMANSQRCLTTSNSRRRQRARRIYLVGFPVVLCVCVSSFLFGRRESPPSAVLPDVIQLTRSVTDIRFQGWKRRISRRGA